MIGMKSIVGVAPIVIENRPEERATSFFAGKLKL